MKSIKKIKPAVTIVFVLGALVAHAQQSWIRINQLGYSNDGVKVAVAASKEKMTIMSFELVDANTSETVFKGKPGKDFGVYGPFHSTFRLDFSAYKKNGRYYLRADKARSPVFEISNQVYKGAADFVLRYMRQQRSGYNPFLK